MPANHLEPEPSSDTVRIGSSAPRKRAVLRAQRREQVLALGNPAHPAELQKPGRDVVVTGEARKVLPP